MAKKCTKCGVEKELGEFTPKKSQPGKYSSWCKECYRKNRSEERLRKRQPRALEKLQLPPPTSKKCGRCKAVKELREFTKNKATKDGLHCWCNPCKREYDRDFQGTPVQREHKRSYEEKPTRLEYNSRRNATPKRKAARREYTKQRCKTDPAYKLRVILRTRLCSAVKNGAKAGSAVRDLGCTVDELKTYLEAKFYPRPVTGEIMDWNNHTKKGWHIDHIKAISRFDLTDREQLLQACHYTNLQPLWSEANHKKGAK
jgi:hypothetical protein